MKRLLPNIKDLKLRSPSLKAAYIKSLFFWNPLWVFVISIFLGGFQDLGNRLAISFLITNLIMHFCFGVVLMARVVVRNLTRAGSENPLLKSKAWNFSVSLFAMPLGLYLSFKIVGIIVECGHLIGVEGLRV